MDINNYGTRPAPYAPLVLFEKSLNSPPCLGVLCECADLPTYEDHPTIHFTTLFPMTCHGCSIRIHGFMVVRAIAQRPADLGPPKLSAIEILRRTRISFQCRRCHVWITVRFEPACRDYILESGAHRILETVWQDLEAGSGSGPNDDNHDPRQRFDTYLVERHSRFDRRGAWKLQLSRTLKWILKEERKQNEVRQKRVDKALEIERDKQDFEQMADLSLVLPTLPEVKPGWSGITPKTEADSLLDTLEQEDLQRESLKHERRREDLELLVAQTIQNTETGNGPKREREHASPPSSPKRKRLG